MNFLYRFLLRYEVRPKVRLEMSMLLKPFIYEYSSPWNSVQVPSSALVNKAGSLIIQGFLFFLFVASFGLQLGYNFLQSNAFQLSHPHTIF